MEYPLTLVVAGPGYGKSVLLSQFHAILGDRALWYSCGPEDGEALCFLRGLSDLFSLEHFSLDDLIFSPSPGEGPMDLELRALNLMLDKFMSEKTGETVLLLDDCHLIPKESAGARFIEYFLTRLPPNLHIVYSSRTSPEFAFLARSRLHQQVLEITQRDLIFDAEEISALAEDWGVDIEDASILEGLSEGWILGVRMLLKSLKEGCSLDSFEGMAGTAFREYVEHEALAQLPPVHRDFLLHTSFLETLHSALCDYLFEIENSREILSEIAASWAFLTPLEEGLYRLHHLFALALKAELEEQPESYKRLLARAAEYFLKEGDGPNAIKYLVEAGSFEGACAHLEYLCEEWILKGGHEAFLNLWRMIPRDILKGYPPLLLKVAGGLRSINLYEPSLEAYTLAYEAFNARGDTEGKILSLSGLARIHLDTLEPFKADEYLEEALELCSEPTGQRARILCMMAENYINRGLPGQAAGFLQEAWKIEGSSPDTTQARLLIRSGELEKAKELLFRLEARDSLAERRVLEAHREAPLLLSFLFSLLGDSSAALRAVEKFLSSPRLAASPASRAVALMRRGHALQLAASYAQSSEVPGILSSAEEDYRSAMHWGETLSVERLKAEPLLGLSLLHSFSGRGDAGYSFAIRGKRISWESGDLWFSHLLGICIGISLFHSGDHLRGREAFRETLIGLERCADRFGQFICRLWLAALSHLIGDREEEERHLDRIRSAPPPEAALVLSGPTLLGPRCRDDLLRLSAALSTPKKDILPPAFAVAREKVASTSGLLKIQTLGPFRVWLRGVEVGPRQWKREKVRRLLQFFIVHRRSPVPRDVIIDSLWPDASPEAAYRDFRVALKALRDVLEPGRSRYSESPFLLREGSCYGLRTPENLWLDVEEFEGLIRKAQEAPNPVFLYLEALELYKGDFMQECLYEDWCARERERLQVLFLEAGSRAARHFLNQKDYQRCLFWCRQILQTDPGHEESYRIMMEAHLAQGQKSLAVRVFQSCRYALEEELGVEPSEETLALYMAAAG